MTPPNIGHLFIAGRLCSHEWLQLGHVLTTTYSGAAIHLTYIFLNGLHERGSPIHFQSERRSLDPLPHAPRPKISNLQLLTTKDVFEARVLFLSTIFYKVKQLS